MKYAISFYEKPNSESKEKETDKIIEADDIDLSDDTFVCFLTAEHQVKDAIRKNEIRRIIQKD